MTARPVAIVTGSSTGIGAAIAGRLGDEGFAVLVNSARSEDAGRTVAERLPQGAYLRADVSDRGAAQRLVDTAVRTFGRLDLIVNNAATTRLIRTADLDSVTDEVWRDILDVNLLGTWHMVQAGVPALRQAGGDSLIINVSSYAALRPITSSLPYAVSKAAVNHLTALLAVSLGPDIRVNAVAPGFVETRWTRDWAEARASVVRRAPARRTGTGDDIAEACLALVRNSYLTGCVLPVDGGLHLR